MLVSKAARRYAIALLELSKEQKSVEATLTDVQFIESTIDDSRELENFLKSPIIKPSMKKEALTALFKEHISDLTMQFVSLVATKERAAILHQISKAFISQYNMYAGIIEVEVRSAKKLSAKQVEELKTVLEKTTSKKVNLSTSEKEELKGGLLVKIEDTVIDGTIKHKIEQLEERLLDNTLELN
ncbi:MAG: ATP synthase F1 subunit delta [bacterium]|jgi:F-type H+-transporting ATPase subunit delta|nr:ATP synthase F1 subunit delta [bacterium]